jgi:AraC family transcriptional regulator, regulatory protein of adaptative response / DNA-3-methyladenine glycosylase II
MTVAGRTAILSYRQPLALAPLLTFLEQRAVAGIEQARNYTYKRSISLTHGWAIVELRGEADHVSCRLELEDVRDRALAVSRCRRLLDLDADPHTIESALARDDRLRPVVARRPGLRVPGTLDPEELAIRAVLGQQVSVAAARTSAARLVVAYGRRLVESRGAITHMWPSMEVLAGSDLQELKVPRTRRDTVRNLAGALADGSLRLDEGAEGNEIRERLLGLAGIGPWTASYIAMRALKEPDAFMATDLGVKRGAVALGLPAEPRALESYSQRWRPWRSYAVQYLWAAPELKRAG